MKQVHYKTIENLLELYNSLPISVLTSAPNFDFDKFSKLSAFHTFLKSKITETDNLLQRSKEESPKKSGSSSTKSSSDHRDSDSPVRMSSPLKRATGRLLDRLSAPENTPERTDTHSTLSRKPLCLRSGIEEEGRSFAFKKPAMPPSRPSPSTEAPQKFDVPNQSTAAERQLKYPRLANLG